MTDTAPTGVELGADLPLNVVLGFQSGTPKESAITKERVEGVAAWLKEVARAIPEFGPFDVTTGILRELANVLDTPLSEIGINLWNKRAEIRKFADESRYPPSETHEVELYEHDFEQTVRPTAEVRLGGRRVGSVTLKATASVTVKAVRLVIRGGWITHIRMGELIGKAVLAVEKPDALKGFKLKEVKSEPWKLNQEFALPGKGVQIHG